MGFFNYNIEGKKFCEIWFRLIMFIIYRVNLIFFYYFVSDKFYKFYNFKW